MKLFNRATTLLIASATLFVATSAGASTALKAGDKVYYTNQISIKAAPPAVFAGGAGGDGWGIVATATQIFNVYHHQQSLVVACHERSDASVCAGYPFTATDGVGNNLTTSMKESMYLDTTTKKLYAYAMDNGTGELGVACVNIAGPSSCGFSSTDAAGSTYMLWGYVPDFSEIGQYGSKIYSVVSNQGTPSNTTNALMCFDTATHAKCPGSPFALGLGNTNLSVTQSSGASLNSIAGKFFIRVTQGPLAGYATNELIACFNPVTNTPCGGNFPLSPDSSVAYANAGTIVPTTDASGSITGFCIPGQGSTMPCYDLAGSSVPMPANLGQVLTFPGMSDYIGQPLLRGSKVFVPISDNVTANSNNSALDCYDYATQSSCTGFPLTPPNMNLLYTVSPDPTDYHCLWLNADRGSAQIQNLDYTNQDACGTGALASLDKSQLYEAPSVCKPSGYQTVTVVNPTSATYSGGQVSFYNSTADLIATVPLVSGSADISALGLETKDFQGLSVNLPGENAMPMDVQVTWAGTYASQCTAGGQTAVLMSAPVLPKTGSNTALLLASSTLAIVCGASALVAARRRKMSNVA